MDKMKALIKMEPIIGGVYLDSVPIPQVGSNDALIKIRTAAICGTDIHIYEWNQWAAKNYQIPLFLGHEFCGEVVKIGQNVHKVKVGDRVSAETHLGCGLCLQCKMGREHTCNNLKVFSKLNVGCFSEYAAVPQNMLRVVPKTINDVNAALLEPLGVSVRAVKEVEVNGEDILVVGCGPIGLFAIAVAKALGARKIIASDVSLSRLEIAKIIGADLVLNPNSVSIPDELYNETGGEGVGVVIETSGNQMAIQTSIRLLRSGGKISMVGIPATPVEIDIAKDIIIKEATIIGIYGRKIFQTWDQTEELIISGKIDISPVLTHFFSLEQYEAAFLAARSQNAGKVIFQL